MTLFIQKEKHNHDTTNMCAKFKKLLDLLHNCAIIGRAGYLLYPSGCWGSSTVISSAYGLPVHGDIPECLRFEKMCRFQAAKYNSSSCTEHQDALFTLGRKVLVQQDMNQFRSD
jgi:hypothetical protein